MKSWLLKAKTFTVHSREQNCVEFSSKQVPLRQYSVPTVLIKSSNESTLEFCASTYVVFSTSYILTACIVFYIVYQHFANQDVPQNWSGKLSKRPMATGNLQDVWLRLVGLNILHALHKTVLVCTMLAYVLFMTICGKRFCSHMRKRCNFLD